MCPPAILTSNWPDVPSDPCDLPSFPGVQIFSFYFPFSFPFGEEITVPLHSNERYLFIYIRLRCNQSWPTSNPRGTYPPLLVFSRYSLFHYSFHDFSPLAFRMSQERAPSVKERKSYFEKLGGGCTISPKVSFFGGSIGYFWYCCCATSHVYCHSWMQIHAEHTVSDSISGLWRSPEGSSVFGSLHRKVQNVAILQFLFLF